MKKGEIGIKSHPNSPILSPFTKAENPSNTSLHKREGTGYKTEISKHSASTGMSQTTSLRFGSFPYLSSIVSHVEFIPKLHMARCLPADPGPYPLNPQVDQERFKFNLPHPPLHLFLRSASSSKAVLSPDSSLEFPQELFKMIPGLSSQI